jgi:hypothetical protein
MANAKEEFIMHVGNKIVKCASIDYCPYSFRYEDEQEETTHILPVNYTQEEYNTFLDSLDFMYDDGYGSQQLHGYIWYVGDTWSDRYEYDGSECWDFHKCPQIPNELIFSTLK